MKFRFPYEKLLKHRKQLEDLAKRDYAAAQRLVDLAQAELRRLYDQVDESRRRGFELEQQGGTHGPHLSMLDEFIVGQKVRIEAQRLKIRQLMEDAERKQAALVEAAKETKTIEKLKEKSWAEFKDLVKKKELKFVDDLVTTRFRRGEDG